MVKRAKSMDTGEIRKENMVSMELNAYQWGES